MQKVIAKKNNCLPWLLLIAVGVLLVLMAVVVLYYLPTKVQKNRLEGIAPTTTEQIEPTDIPSGETGQIAPSAEILPTSKPLTRAEVYEDKYVKFTIPQGWKKVLSDDDGSLVRIEKNGYYFSAVFGIVTGGGYGYPYDGVCQITGARKSSIKLPKLGDRYDEYYDLNTNKALNPEVYGDNAPFKTEAELCNVNPNTQKGKVVWLGSRFGADGQFGTTSSTYFNDNNESSVMLFVTYSHQNIDNSSVTDGKTYAFPVFDSAELKTMLTEMDNIAKTVVYKKAVEEGNSN